MELGDFLRLGLLIVGLPLLVTLLGVARLRFRRPARRYVRWEQVPDVVRETVAPAALELAARGFELLAPVELEPTEVAADDTRIVLQLHQPETRTWAYLGVQGAQRARPHLLSLETFVPDAEGRLVMWLSEPGWETPDLAQSSRLRVAASPRGNDVMALLDAHLAALATQGAAAELEPEGALALGTSCHAVWLDEGVASGRLVREGDLFRYGLLGAVRTAVWARYRSDGLKASTHNASLGMGEPPPPAELEARRHLQLESVSQRALPRSLALTLFGLGALLSTLWFAASDPMFGVLLLGVILFHELGHATAMRALGYVDTRIYLIPGLGGAAVGHKRDASIHAESIVLLAGPVPGILLGLALGLVLPQLPASLAHVTEPLFALAVVALFVNLVNLLPALPLDGGRLAHRIVGGIHPAIDVGLRVLSIAVLGAGALAMGDLLLGMFALVFVLQTPTAYRAAMLERSLRADGAAGWTERARIEETYRRMTLRGSERRRTLATQVLVRLAAPEASWLARVSWAGVYLAVLVVPIVVALVVSVALALAATLPDGAPVPAW